MKQFSPNLKISYFNLKKFKILKLKLMVVVLPWSIQTFPKCSLFVSVTKARLRGGKKILSIEGKTRVCRK
jgi:hypothetical protein